MVQHQKVQNQKDNIRKTTNVQMSPDAVAAHDGVMSQVAVVADVSMMSGIVARVLRVLRFL